MAREAAMSCLSLMQINAARRAQCRKAAIAGLLLKSATARLADG
jgi:hypothetical protein